MFNPENRHDAAIDCTNAIVDASTEYSTVAFYVHCGIDNALSRIRDLNLSIKACFMRFCTSFSLVLGCV